jgi:ribosomal protein S18 acetylase RimI-like enzyme
MQHDIKHLKLTVDKSNTRAIGLYKKYGFTEVSPSQTARHPSDETYYVMDNPSLAKMS